MTVRAKLAISYTVIILIFIALGAFVTLSLRTISRELPVLDRQFELAAQQTQVLEAAARMQVSLPGARLALARVTLDDPQTLSAFQDSFDVLQADFDALETGYAARLEDARADDVAELPQIEANWQRLQQVAAEEAQMQDDVARLLVFATAGDREQVAALAADIESRLSLVERQLGGLVETGEAGLAAASTAFDTSLEQLGAATARMLTITLLLLLLAVLVAAGFAIAASRLITRPVEALAHAAWCVEAETFELDGLEPVAARRDEFGVLARVFGRMAEEVRAREQALREQVQELRIQLDRGHIDKQVSEITESDFFQELTSRAATMRRARQQPPDESD